MKRRSVILFLTACIAVICMALVGCQPTPELAPVVNKREDAVEQAAKETDEEPEADAIEEMDAIEPVEYKATEHWTETIEKADFFKVEVDAEIMMPTVTRYPVEKLEMQEMSQQQVDKMLAYFTDADAKFYNYPLPPTKEYYEQEIISLKQSLAQVEAGGDGETPEAIRSYIEEAERNLAKAPEQLELEYVEPVYSFDKNYQTWEEDTTNGANYMNLALADGNGGASASVWASRYEPGKTYSNGFGFGSGGTYESEVMLEDRERWVKQDEEWANGIAEEPYRSTELQRVQEQRDYMDQLKTALDANDMDLQAAKEIAIGLLEEFGIEDVQITDCVKAVYEPEKLELSWGYYDPNAEYEQKIPSQNACYIGFSRECGGIPVKVQLGGGMSSSDDKRSEDTYSSPFYIETGSMLINEAGEVLDFYWSDAAKTVEQVTADSELVSIEEIKKRAIDQLFFNSTSWIREAEKEGWEYEKPQMRYVVDKMELCMTYINAKDDPDSMLVVPAWRIGAQGYEAYPESEYNDGSERMSNYEEVLINALDGGVIYMPGMDRMYEDMQQSMAEEAEAMEEA